MENWVSGRQWGDSGPRSVDWECIDGRMLGPVRLGLRRQDFEYGLQCHQTSLFRTQLQVYLQDCHCRLARGEKSLLNWMKPYLQTV